MVVPFPPGGSIDIVSRSIVERWSPLLGQQIVVDNRGGAGSGLHLKGELFKSVAGVDIVHVPFKGMGQAAPEIASGRVQLAKLLRAESAKWSKVIKAIGLKGE